ncbi:Hypothetical predicted protein [Marmota monax]|uniref:Suppressor of tumorigenicity 7 protein n=1 Tax=Marmota monax TaxID=9995 RepID=A0A5E4CKL1_MARMO|nr:hypothetical protein GHT09_013150 [Marmota monax]VTJ82404.1 Hypothetical predicted protein [Marmota monax]
MAEAATGFLEQLKSCMVWSWTYLCTVWFFIVLFLVYILRVPLKINDNLSTGGGRRPSGARGRRRRSDAAWRARPATTAPRPGPTSGRDLLAGWLDTREDGRRERGTSLDGFPSGGFVRTAGPQCQTASFPPCPEAGAERQKLGPVRLEWADRCPVGSGPPGRARRERSPAE